MATALSNFVNNLSEGIHKTKCKYKHDEKNVKLAELNNVATVFLNTQTLKMITLNTNVYVVMRIIKKSLIKRFFNTYKFPNHFNNKFILLLLKGVYPCEYMDD